jgi:hypothetical protein
MTWRVDRIVGCDDIVTLCISGRITKEDVDTLRNVIEQDAGAAAIDLKNLILVDREAVRFLAQREIKGAIFRNCPRYIRNWVTREQLETIETIGGEDVWRP